MKKILTLLSLIFVISCVNNGVRKGGHVLDYKDVKQIKAGITDKQKVLELLDYPLITPHSEKNKWIYYSYKTKQFLFFKPKIIEQKVIILSFNEADTVSHIDEYNLKDKVSVNINNSRTPIDNKDRGILSDIFHNIGTITPGI